MSGQKKGKEAVLFPGERLDDLQLNGLELIQDPKKFCFGVDAVFLSDFVKIKAGERALIWEQGTGLYRYCCLKRRRDVILQVWRFSRRWQRWLEEV